MLKLGNLLIFQKNILILIGYKMGHFFYNKLNIDYIYVYYDKPSPLRLYTNSIDHLFKTIIEVFL